MGENLGKGGAIMKEQMKENAKTAGSDGRQHGLSLENRSRAVLTGVSDVKSFHEEEVILDTAGGEMVITGKSLHIAKFTLEDGSLVMDGRIDAITYQEGGRHKKGGNVLGRMFR
jgi:sporulation protein YabP